MLAGGTLLVSLRAPVSFGGRELDSSCVEVTAQWVCVKGDGEDDVGDGHDIWPENLVLLDCVRPRRRKCFGISLRCCRLGCLRVGWMLMLGCDTPHSESRGRRHTRQRPAVLRLRLCDLVGSLSVAGVVACMTKLIV